MLVFALDPGVSNGAAVLSVEKDEPSILVAGFQRAGGVVGLLGLVGDLRPFGEGVWICEKFTARNTRGFAYTTSSLEPLRCEGALIALGLMPDYTPSEKRYRDPSLQYFSGGSGKAERKKRQHAFLKANGFYKTGKDFGTADADDFRSAAAHGIAYIARELKHKPTFDMLAGNGEGN